MAPLDPLPELPPNARYLRHPNSCFDFGTIGWVLDTEVGGAWDFSMVSVPPAAGAGLWRIPLHALFSPLPACMLLPSPDHRCPAGHLRVLCVAQPQRPRPLPSNLRSGPDALDGALCVSPLAHCQVRGLQHQLCWHRGHDSALGARFSPRADVCGSNRLAGYGCPARQGHHLQVLDKHAQVQLTCLLPHGFMQRPRSASCQPVT